MDKLERLRSAYKYLMYKGLIASQRDLAVKMNAAETNVSSALNGMEKSLTDNFLKRMNAAFGNIFNTKWLIMGDGEMLNPKAGEVVKTKTIRYYPEVEGTAGGVQFLNNPDERYVNISVPCAVDCTCAINVTGNSMSPLIKSGQIVLLTEWTERFIDWGRIYLVVTKSGYRCVKYLYPAKVNTSVTCHSEDSEAYPDFDIERDDIERLFLVRGWICRDAI